MIYSNVCCDGDAQCSTNSGQQLKKLCVLIWIYEKTVWLATECCAVRFKLAPAGYLTITAHWNPAWGPRVPIFIPTWPFSVSHRANVRLFIAAMRLCTELSVSTGHPSSIGFISRLNHMQVTAMKVNLK